jgi:hypothetical protein
MKRIATAVMMVVFALTVPVMADKRAEKNAKQQCSVEFKVAKKNAEGLSTKRARAAAKKNARVSYEACTKRAKNLR